MLISCTKNLVVPNSFCFLFPDSRTQTGFDRNCCFCTDSAVCRSKIELDQVKRVQERGRETTNQDKQREEEDDKKRSERGKEGKLQTTDKNPGGTNEEVIEYSK